MAKFKIKRRKVKTMAKVSLQDFSKNIRHDDPLEKAIFILLKAENMRYKNIKDKHDKINKLIDEAKNELDSYVTGV